MVGRRSLRRACPTLRLPTPGSRLPTPDFCPMPSNLTAAPRLGNVLIERGYLTVEQLTAALDEQRSSAGKLLGEILIESSFCTDDQIIECLALVYGVPYAKLEPRIADPKIVDCLPRE